MTVAIELNPSGPATRPSRRRGTKKQILSPKPNLQNTRQAPSRRRFDFGRSGVALLHSAAPKHAQAHKPRLKRSPPPKTKLQAARERPVSHQCKLLLTFLGGRNSPYFLQRPTVDRPYWRHAMVRPRDRFFSAAASNSTKARTLAGRNRAGGKTAWMPPVGKLQSANTGTSRPSAISSLTL